MKKAYSKPQILFEDFTLSTNIAAGCEVRVEGHSSGTCGYKMGGGIVVFVSAETGCNTHEPDGDLNGLCYHVPIETNNLFNS